MNKDKEHLLKNNINQAADILKAGGLVAFPTETYYGLAVDPFNINSLEKLFKVKKRSFIKPILLLVSQRSQLDLLTDSVSDAHLVLMNHFWPGPLTLLFPAKGDLPELITGRTNTVGVRQSPNPVAQDLLLSFGGPLTATSANISGQKPAVCADEVEKYFGTDVDYIIDGGKTPGGLGSTLVGYKEEKLEVIREGQVLVKLIEEVISCKCSSF